MSNHTDDLLPKWAVEITVKLAELNAKLSPHIDWVERNVKDHEQRIRALEKETDTNSWLPRISWTIVGCVATAAITFFIKN